MASNRDMYDYFVVSSGSDGEIVGTEVVEKHSIGVDALPGVMLVQSATSKCSAGTGKDELIPRVCELVSRKGMDSNDGGKKKYTLPVRLPSTECCSMCPDDRGGNGRVVRVSCQSSGLLHEQLIFCILLSYPSSSNDSNCHSRPMSTHVGSFHVYSGHYRPPATILHLLAVAERFGLKVQRAISPCSSCANLAAV